MAGVVVAAPAAIAVVKVDAFILQLLQTWQLL
jgi:hypothetical protein